MASKSVFELQETKIPKLRPLNSSKALKALSRILEFALTMITQNQNSLGI